MKARGTLVVLVFFLFSNLYGFERSQVSRYADRWVKDWAYYPEDTLRNAGPYWNSLDPADWDKQWPYHNYSLPGKGSDCANYVSQCLIAGGLCFWVPPHDMGSIHPSYTDDRGAIINCDSLDVYLRQLYWATRTSIVYPNGSPPSGFEKGDFLIFGDETGDWFRHAAIVSGGSGSNAYCNAHDNDRYHRSWNWAWGTGSGQYKRVSFYEIPDNAGWWPDLAPFQPPDWPDILIVSSTPGNHLDDAILEAGETVYIDFAVVNWAYLTSDYDTLCADIPDTEFVELYMNGQLIGRFYLRGHWGGYYAVCEDFSFTIPSNESWNSITFELLVDPDNYWIEYKEDNNYYSKTYAYTGIQEGIWVTKPSGSINDIASTSYEIQWYGYFEDQAGGDVSLYYDTDNQGYDGVLIASGLPLSGSYLWDVSSLPDGEYWVYAIENLRGVSDYSDGCLIVDHTPPSISIISPSFSSGWRPGEVRKIKWEATDNYTSSYQLKVRSISYSTDDGNTWIDIPLSSSDSLNDGEHEWVVPSVSSYSCRIKIEMEDRAGNIGVAVSDRFAIVDEVVINNSFEYGLIAWEKLDGVPMEVETGAVHGDSCVKFILNGVEDYASLRQVDIPVVPGESYWLSGWIKTSLDGGRAKMDIRDGAGAYSMCGNLRGDNEWRYVYTQFIPQGNRAQIRLVAREKIGGLTNGENEL